MRKILHLSLSLWKCSDRSLHLLCSLGYFGNNIRFFGVLFFRMLLKICTKKAFLVLFVHWVCSLCVLSFFQVTQGDLRRIYEVYQSLPNKKGDPERVIVELVRRLNAAGDPQLMRKIGNFVRSLLMPDRKVSVSVSENSNEVFFHFCFSLYICDTCMSNTRKSVLIRFPNIKKWLDKAKRNSKCLKIG